MSSKKDSSRIPGWLAIITLLCLFLYPGIFSESYAQVVLTENFATGGPHVVAQNPFGGGGGNTTLPPGWSQGKVGAGADIDNRWDRPQGTVTGSGSASNSAPAVNPRSYFASATGLVCSVPANSYSLTINAPGHTRSVGEKIHIDFTAFPATLSDGTFTITSVVAGTSITVAVPNTSALLRSGQCRYYYDSNLRYFADQINSGESAYVSTPRFDFSGWTAGTPAFSFWMYRDNGAPQGDNIQVYLNDSALFTSAASAVLLTENTTTATTLYRYYNTVPVASANTWVQYTYNLNIATIPAVDRDNVYIVIVGTSAGGDNINIDDVVIQTYPSVQTFGIAEVFYQNDMTTGPGAYNQDIIGCKVVADNAGGPMMMTDLTFNTNGSTNVNADIASAKLFYTGGNSLFDFSNAILVGTVVAPNFTNFSFNLGASVAGVNAQMPGGTGISLQNGENYFWLVYDIKTGATPNNFVDAEWVSFSYGFRKQNVVTTAASNVIVVPDNLGIAIGMSVSGPGMVGGTLVTSIAGNNITVSSPATASSSTATVYFTVNNAMPSPFSLPQAREIDQIYCIPQMTYGCWNMWGYTLNDYIRAVRFDGNRPGAGIITGAQPSAPFAIPVLGYNRPAPPVGDCDGVPFHWALNCPFSAHPDDYQLFTPDSLALTTTDISFDIPYPITVTAGTWYSHNYFAAWIDFNKQSGFNDTLFMATNVSGYGIPNGTNSPVATTITLSSPLPIRHGIFSGTRVYNNGVYVGSVSVTPLAGAVNVLLASSSVPAGTVTGPVYFINPTGEKLFQSGPMNALTSHTATVYVPSDLSPPIVASNIRLRVREVYAVSTITACGNWSFGETEDYILKQKPVCNAVAFGVPPGYNRIWLGYTSDWSDPINWCGGIPTINDNVAIPDPAYLVSGANAPVIKTGASATAKGLWIGPNQVLTIDAPGGGSLTVGDSIQISAPTSKLRIISGDTDSCQVNNGNLSTLNDFWRGGPSPLGATDFSYKKARAIWYFAPTELIVKGMRPGDQIDKIWMNLERVNDPIGTPTAQGYQNVKVKMYYVSTATFSGFPATGTPGISLPVPSTSPVTVFSGNVTDAVGLANGTKFKRTLSFSTPFVWSGSTNEFVVVDMSYDNGVVNNSTGTDDNRCSPTLWGRSYILMYPTTPVNGTPAEFLTPTSPNTNVTTHQVENYKRPNLTFEISRPYSSVEFPIYVNTSWHNNGSFEGGVYVYKNYSSYMPPFSKVSMVGSQDGAVLGSTQTTFHHLVVNKAAGTNRVTRFTDFTVTDTLELNVGRLSLNGNPLYPNGLVTVNNATQTARIVSRPSPLSTAYPGGYIESENTGGASLNPYGKIRWNIGSVPGVYRFPFIQKVADGNNFVGFDFELVSGSADLTVATYKTPATNVPTPTGQGLWVDVTNINSYFTGANNSSSMVDRYWMISNAQSGTANMVLNFAPNEEPFPTVAPYMAQRWVANAGSITPGPGWEYPFHPSQNNLPLTRVTLNNISDFSNIWTLTGLSEPLPVEVLDFTAIPVEDQVQIDWVTAGEIDNDYFIVERSVNHSEFTFIDKLQSKGPIAQGASYRTWDRNPLSGLQFYYLRQYDKAGRMMSYGPVPVEFGKDRFDIITAVASASENGVTVVFDYDSTEPYSYTLVDMLGKVIASSNYNSATNGVNVLEIPVKLTKGMYNIILRNSEKQVSRKMVY